MTLTVDGAKLRRLREEAGMTREDFIVRARELGHKLSVRTLARLESDDDEDSTLYLSTLETLAAVLKLRSVRPLLATERLLA